MLSSVRRVGAAHVYETCRPYTLLPQLQLYSRGPIPLLVYVQPKPITTSNPIFPSVHPQISLSPTSIETHPPHNSLQPPVRAYYIVARLILLKAPEKSSRVGTSETDFRRCWEKGKWSRVVVDVASAQQVSVSCCVCPSSGRSASNPPGINSLPPARFT